MGSCRPSKLQNISQAQLVVSVKTSTTAAFGGSSRLLGAVVQQVSLVKAQHGLVSACGPGG